MKTTETSAENLPANFPFGVKSTASFRTPTSTTDVQDCVRVIAGFVYYGRDHQMTPKSHFERNDITARHFPT
jgi:hypothetical protein